MGERTEIEKLKSRVEQNENEIYKLEKRIAVIEAKSVQCDKDIEDLKKYRDIVIELKKDIKSILDQIQDIKDVASQKSKNSLTIAIAILSPMFTALIAFLMWTWFYKPIP